MVPIFLKNFSFQFHLQVVKIQCHVYEQVEGHVDRRHMCKYFNIALTQ